jgi:acyl-coenzyme A synthetase/AMP-(fatty) acid ligase
VEHVRAHIASYKKPRSVIFVEALPRLNGSVDREQVRRNWGDLPTDD